MRRSDADTATIVVAHFLKQPVIAAAGMFVVGFVARFGCTGQECRAGRNTIARFPRCRRGRRAGGNRQRRGKTGTDHAPGHGGIDTGAVPWPDPQRPSQVSGRF